MAQKTSIDTNSAALPRWSWAMAATLCVIAYSFGLSLPFLGPDEPRYAQVAREMYERGDWVTPTLGGYNWFEKPALLYWLDISSYHLFGVSEGAARLGPAVFGLGVVGALWILGRLVAPASPFANWLALITASSLGILVFAHGGSFDIIVTFPLTASLVSIFVYAERDRKDEAGQISALILFYFFIGISLLAKGLIGIVFPLGIAGLFFGLSGKIPGRRFWLSLMWGVPFALMIAATWYVPMYLRHGEEFIDQFIIQHHFERFLSNKYQHPQPFYFFFWVLPLMTLPWLPFIVASIWTYLTALFRRTTAVDTDPVMKRLVLFSACWIAVPLLFFSFSGSKLPGYILPAVPGAVILGGSFIYQLVKRSRNWRVLVYSLACAVFAASSLLTYTLVPRFTATESVKGMILTARTQGYGDVPVFSLHTVSQNAEFYAAGRLLRGPDGQQKKLYSPAELVSEMERAGVRGALVLVPLEYAGQITGSPLLLSKAVDSNGELALFAVELP